jgi:hypothetical protein
MPRPDPMMFTRWRKSSYSAGNGGACVELACEIATENWRKSSYSAGNGGACVELAHRGAVRDSKNPTGPVLTTPLGEFLAVVKAGRFDRRS